jgi:hypothetical protein
VRRRIGGPARLNRKVIIRSDRTPSAAWSMPRDAGQEHFCPSAATPLPPESRNILHRCGPGLSIQPCPASPPFPRSPRSRPDEPSRSGLKPVPSPARWTICGMRLQGLGNTTRSLKRPPRVPLGLSGVGAHAPPEGQGAKAPRQITIIVAISRLGRGHARGYR